MWLRKLSVLPLMQLVLHMIESKQLLQLLLEPLLELLPARLEVRQL